MVQEWVHEILRGPCTKEDISRRLTKLLEIDELSANPDSNSVECKFRSFLWNANWIPRPDKIDDIWRAIFEVAEKRGWSRLARDVMLEWAEGQLGNGAGELPGVGEEDIPFNESWYDDDFITSSLGCARLFSLGYTYAGYAFTAFLNGLGLSSEDGEPNPHDPEENSDSQRIASCAQLLGAGRRIKLYYEGGGDDHDTPGFAGRWLIAVEDHMKTPEYKALGDSQWKKIIDGLSIEQTHACPRAAKLLQLTLDHLQSTAPDMTSEQVAAIIWPEKQFRTNAP